MNKKNNNKKVVILTGLSLAVLFLLSQIKQPYFHSVLIMVFIFSTLTMFYNILYGFAGVYNFGYAGFFAIGAYVSALLAMNYDLPLPLTIIVAALLSGVFGIGIMALCLNMHRYTIGIVTLAFGEIVRITLIAATDITRGVRGLWGIPPLFSASSGYVFAGGLLVLIVYITIWALMKTNWGLALRAIHDDEIAASSTGIYINKYKLSAMAISSAGAGLSGAFYAHYIMTISPSISGLSYTIQIFCMTLVGGAGTLVGPILGASSVYLFTELLRYFEDFRMLSYGILLIVIIMFFPKGIMGIVRKVESYFLQFNKKRFRKGDNLNA